MATATWTITEDDIFDLLLLATMFNNDQQALSFTADEIPTALASTLVNELLVLHDTKAKDFEPWGRKLARWANTSVPVVVAAIEADGALKKRVTQSGDVRVTENGSIRIIEG